MLLQMALLHYFLTAEQCPVVCVYHIFFIQSSADEHLAYFYVLAIVNSAAMNIKVHISF